MTRITFDSALRSRLLNSNELLELCDESGKVTARVHHVFNAEAWEPREPPISEEELDDREKSTVWFTTAEVLNHLERL